MDNKAIRFLKLPSEEYNIAWRPGEYTFIGNNSLYRVGVSMHYSRARVMQHIKASSAKVGFCINDIDRYPDKSILLINVKNKSDKHWLLSLEVFLETKF